MLPTITLQQKRTRMPQSSTKKVIVHIWQKQRTTHYKVYAMRKSIISIIVYQNIIRAKNSVYVRISSIIISKTR